MRVAQGSLLGPLLFSLTINNFPSVCNIKIIMYADDDTVVFIHCKNAAEVTMTLTTEMKKLVAFLQSSCLALNFNKTVVMYFTN